MKKHSIGTLVALTTTVLLSGCALYFGDEHDRGDSWTYCGTDGYYKCDGDNCQWQSATCPAPGSATPTDPNEFECRDNGDCAAGCYCANGVCEEAGFCTQDSDCGEGYTCNEDRSSCEPGGPVSCDWDYECAQGEYCALDHTCTATCVCTDDETALANGFGWCDETRSTCLPGQDPAGSCGGVATCNQLPPSCPSGSVPKLIDGCYTGTCEVYAQCDVAPVCSHINDEVNCLARTDCSASVNGINCTKPDGTACQVGDSNCSCEQLVFAACRGL